MTTIGKKLMLLSILILFFGSCKGKKEVISYPDFYRGYNEVKLLIKNDDLKNAINKFDSLCLGVPHVPANCLFRMARACAEKGQCELASKYLERSIENGKEYGKGVGKKEITGNCEGIKNVLARETEIHQKHFNNEYKAIIDSMVQKDQETRNNSDFEQMRITDSLNMETLLNLINKYGFPNEKTIGEASAFYAFIMLLHMDRDEGNKVFKPILEKAYNEGFLSPTGLAWIVDRRRSWGPQKLEPYYYHMPSKKFDAFTQEQKDEINRRRDSIGLAPK